MRPQFCAANPCPFHHKATAQHGQKPQENDQIFTAIIQAGRLHNVAAVRESCDANETQQPKHIEG